MNRVVREITEMTFKGNTIDNGWYKHLRYENGKVNLNAVVILGEIVYLYRGCKKKNENSGVVVKNNQKFKGDKLQKSYQALSEQFGLTKRQVKEACDFLKEKGFITVEYRSVRLTDGRIMSNVIFFEPVVENIMKMSCCYENTDNVYTESDDKNLGVDKQKDTTISTTVKGNGCNCEELQMLHLNVIGDTFNGGTYTENTTEITTKNTTDNNISCQKRKEAEISEEPVSNETRRSETIGDEKGVNALNKYAICKEIIEYLNLKTGKNYREFSKANKKVIRAKLEEGYTKEELMKVIDNKVFSWSGTIYERYLRPATLFGDKFDEYLNEEKKDHSEVRDYKKSSFCNFVQRPYDGSAGGITISELEKMLLGW